MSQILALVASKQTQVIFKLRREVAFFCVKKHFQSQFFLASSFHHNLKLKMPQKITKIVDVKVIVIDRHLTLCINSIQWQVGIWKLFEI